MRRDKLPGLPLPRPPLLHPLRYATMLPRLAPLWITQTHMPGPGAVLRAGSFACPSMLPGAKGMIV